jgi:hypothetical protein
MYRFGNTHVNPGSPPGIVLDEVMLCANDGQPWHNSKHIGNSRAFGNAVTRLNSAAKDRSWSQLFARSMMK